jgi:putative ABC transport system permease protein
LPGRRVWVLGVPPEVPAQIAPSQLVRGSLHTADEHLSEGGWAAVSQTIAREKHLRIGGSFTLPTPTGDARLRLAATIANYGWLPGAIVMNEHDHARLWASTTATQLAVKLKPGIAPDQGKHEIEQALPAHTALAVNTSSSRKSEVNAVLGSTLSRLDATTIIVLIATVTSVLALMMAAVSQRRGRLNSLISIGMDFRQLTRLVFYESGIALLSGCLLGSLAGLLGQYLIDGWLTQTTGASLRFAPAWELGARTLAIGAGISLAASVIAVLQTIKLQPRAAFSTE